MQVYEGVVRTKVVVLPKGVQLAAALALHDVRQTMQLPPTHLRTIGYRTDPSGCGGRAVHRKPHSADSGDSGREPRRTELPRWQSDHTPARPRGNLVTRPHAFARQLQQGHRWPRGPAENTHMIWRHLSHPCRAAYCRGSAPIGAVIVGRPREEDALYLGETQSAGCAFTSASGAAGRHRRRKNNMAEGPLTLPSTLGQMRGVRPGTGATHRSRSTIDWKVSPLWL